jgi:glycosyltransferase involved in cell wall biosynthesis
MQYGPYKILFLITQLEYAGAQKAMLVLASELKNRGYFVSVATMYDKAGCITEFNQRYNLDIIDLKMKGKGKPNILIQFAEAMGGSWKLFWLMRRENFDILQTYSHYSNMLGPFIAWLAGVRIRLSSQRVSLRGYPRWLLLLDRLVANSFLVDTMVTVSDGTLKFCVAQGISRGKLVNIYNGIDTKIFKPNLLSNSQLQHLRQDLNLAENEHVIVTVARLHSQKGHKYLLKAIPSILEKYPQTKFLLIGDGVERSKLEKLASDLNIANNIAFLGVRKDIPEILNISTLFVLPSLWEGLPNSVLEAMAVGLPVVTTDIDGCSELIVNEETGILIPPADSDAIENAVCRLLSDRGLRSRICLASIERAIIHFSLEQNIKSYVELYEFFGRRNRTC